ncbi:MAG: hypothetical protein IPJ30_16330 [Acidobacteria bacterium]|nr:hypothetical protein [Acidobacteriota bacterium]
MSYALELEKSLKSVAGAIESATDGDARKHLRAAGERIIELAKSIDILPEDSAAGAPQIPEADQTEEMRKQLADAQTREADLRTQFDEATGISKSRKPTNFGFWIWDFGLVERRRIVLNLVGESNKSTICERSNMNEELKPERLNSGSSTAT